MRVSPRLLGLVLVGLATLAVPAFAGAGIAGLAAKNGEFNAWISGVDSANLMAPAEDAAVPEIEVSGVVVSIGPESWVVGDQTLLVTPDTEIKDAIVVGDTVHVHALQNPDGTLTAREIELELEDSSLGDQNDGEVQDGAIEDTDDGEVEDGAFENADDGEVEDDAFEDVDDADVGVGDHADVDGHDVENDDSGHSGSDGSGGDD